MTELKQKMFAFHLISCGRKFTRYNIVVLNACCNVSFINKFLESLHLCFLWTLNIHSAKVSKNYLVFFVTVHVFD